MVLDIKIGEVYDVIEKGYFIKGGIIKILDFYEYRGEPWVKYKYLNNRLGETSKDRKYFLINHLKRNKVYESKLYKAINETSR